MDDDVPTDGFAVVTPKKGHVPMDAPKKPRGFAAISPEQRREISRKGGKAVAKSGRGHRWTKAEAREHGRKGGIASRGGRGKEPS